MNIEVLRMALERGIAFSLIVLSASCRAPFSENQEASQTRLASEPAAAESPGEIQALEARAAELEQTLKRVQETQRGDTGLADVPKLIQLLDQVDGAGLSGEMEKLLLAGEPGFKILHDFFHRIDVEHEKILVFTHHPQAIYASLRLVALHPEEVARLAQYLMTATEDRPDSYIRREIFNFFPIFLRHHQGRFAAAKQDLEKMILSQIHQGGDYLEKVRFAMKDLDYAPPTECFLDLLTNPRKSQRHLEVVDYLVTRKEEGLKVVVEYIDHTLDYKQAGIAHALKVLAGSPSGGEPEKLQKYLQSSNPGLRHAAIWAYFNFSRPAPAAPLALAYLNGQDELRQMRAFLTLLRQKSPEVLSSIKSQADSLTNPQVKTLLLAPGAAKIEAKQP